jgi:hypothetical protein
VADAQRLSEAVVIWTGYGTRSWPSRSEDQLTKVYGDEALGLLHRLRELESEFYESEARYTAPDLASMGDAAARRFRQLHPELTTAAVEALAWCYTFDYK